MFWRSETLAEPMETPEDELERLRREEKIRLHGDLAKLSASIDNLSVKVEKLAPQSAVEQLADRVSVLENYKWLILGGFCALAGLQGIQAVLAILTKNPPP